MQKTHIRLGRGDALLFVITTLLIIFEVKDNYSISESYMLCVWMITAIYALFRLLLTIAPQITRTILK